MQFAKYDHRHIEEKWQRHWEDLDLFRAEIDKTRPKFYILDMFPYPSGAGLHVGHVAGYTITDVIARYKRQKGFNVLHPMGWDSFGLPAEQYAIRTGTHPAVTTQKNIATYRRQLKALGLSYDWSREVTTSDPDYYKWTQWLFTLLYNKGLAYEAEVLVNFCPALGTVLANEEVEEGRAKEGGYPVERRPLRQWILRITEYADRLLQDLDLVDWPEHLKKLQVHWIGRSVGARIQFIEGHTKESISVFTTRPDTLFGASYLVLAPEHPLVHAITTIEQRGRVEAYQKEVASKSDLERTDLNKQKSGVWTGAYATNPVTGLQMPIWISDYVLAHYGTGAIMAVPAHDARDFAFAQAFGLPILPIIDPDVVAYPEQMPEDLTPDDVRVQVLAGTRCWTEGGTLIRSAHGALSLDGLCTEEAKERVIEWLEATHQGKRAVSYKLRDWLFSRQRYWGEPFPILHFEDGTHRVLDVDELPLCPPQVSDFSPSQEGLSPFTKVQDWVELIDPKTGRKARRETNTMPQWAGSCWYYLRFCDPHNAAGPWSSESEQYWMPVDLYVGGVEHAVLHLLYARFWHKVFYDCNLVHTPEPFQTLKNQGLLVSRSYRLPAGGYIAPEEVYEKDGRYYQMGTHKELTSQIEKMSKSKLNIANPDEMIETYGADALRLYEMFMGPFDKEKFWNSDAITGCRRFLQRFYDLFFSDRVCDEVDEEALKLGHRLVQGVQRDIESMQFNTAIAKMMEFLNAFSPLAHYPRAVLKMLTQVLYPFAPHIAEEAWQHLGETSALTYAPFPEVDPIYLVDATTTYVVQVNGKMRGKWELPKDQSEEQILAFIRQQPHIAKHIVGEIRKVIFIPNTLINLVLHG